MQGGGEGILSLAIDQVSEKKMHTKVDSRKVGIQKGLTLLQVRYCTHVA